MSREEGGGLYGPAASRKAPGGRILRGGMRRRASRRAVKKRMGDLTLRRTRERVIAGVRAGPGDDEERAAGTGTGSEERRGRDTAQAGRWLRACPQEARAFLITFLRAVLRTSELVRRGPTSGEAAGRRVLRAGGRGGRKPRRGGSQGKANETIPPVKRHRSWRTAKHQGLEPPPREAQRHGVLSHEHTISVAGSVISVAAGSARVFHLFQIRCGCRRRLSKGIEQVDFFFVQLRERFGQLLEGCLDVGVFLS